MKTHSTLRRIFCITWIIAGLTFGPHPALAQAIECAGAENDRRNKN